jgi:hypothetical protein
VNPLSAKHVGRASFDKANRWCLLPKHFCLRVDLRHLSRNRQQIEPMMIENKAAYNSQVGS